MRGFFGGVLRAGVNLGLVAWVVATLTFFLMRAIPGGPLSQERELPAAVQAALAARYRLDQPLWRQYAAYLGDAAIGRFGLSYNEPGRAVGEIIAERLPVSAVLGAVALLLAVAVAFPLGSMAALRRGGWADRASAALGVAGVAVPSFIMAALLLFIFTYQFRLFPAGGWGRPEHVLLPAIALAALPAAFLTRLVRSQLLEVLHSEFLLTARMKGLPEWRVVQHHALRHTLGPVLAWLGPQAAGVFTGSFVVERIFNIPGLGQYFVNAISNRDYPMIMGVTLVYTVLLVAANLLMDLCAMLADPRLREQGA
jgi:oligopeptide transport system permease protein